MTRFVLKSFMKNEFNNTLLGFRLMYTSNDSNRNIGAYNGLSTYYYYYIVKSIFFFVGFLGTFELITR